MATRLSRETDSFARGFAKIWTATTLRRLPSHAANRHRVLPRVEKQLPFPDCSQCEIPHVLEKGRIALPHGNNL